MAEMGGYRRLCGQLSTTLESILERIAKATVPDADPREGSSELSFAQTELAHLVSTLSCFSGTFEIKREAVELLSWAQSLQTELQKQELPPEISLELSPELRENPPAASLDLGLLTQAVTHLVTNSAEANAKVVAIRLDLQGRPLGGPILTITVKDDGEGISRRMQQVGMLPFISEGKSGAGLGLAMVSGVAHAHRGGLRLKSRSGPGTTATLLLPLSGQPHGSASKAPKATILVVDDEPLAREAVGRVLNVAGYAALKASGAAEAMELARDPQHKLDLVLCDVNMPEMGGFELAEKIVAEYPHLKVLFMCGYPAETIPGAPPGAHFVDKPFTHQELTTAIERRLERKPISD